jgi:signal transduction histidine kinase
MRKLGRLAARATTWISNAPLVPSRSATALVLLGASILTLGVIDYATGPILSLALFYLIPVALGTVLAGRPTGMALAAASAVVATVADFFSPYNDDPVYVINGVLLLVTLAAIVVLIAAVRDSALAGRDSARRGREFLAYAAHQLRTPLAGIRASTDALLVAGGTNQQERLLVNLSREADRAGRLLASLLQMARLDQGELPGAKAHDLVELCRSELDRLAHRAGDLALRLEAPEPQPGPVLLSAEATRDALANLLDNARRHARSEIIVSVTASPSTLQIAVADDGPGLPEGVVERVFERFVSLDGKGGSGLGLPIARGLVEAQGGRLSYEGHRFLIRLPNRHPVETPGPVLHG